MSCAPITRLPALLSLARGSRLGLSLDFADELGEGQTVSAATTSVDRSPADSESPVEATDNDDTTSSFTLNIASDQVYGRYYLRHVVTTSDGRQFVESIVVLVEPV